MPATAKYELAQTDIKLNYSIELLQSSSGVNFIVYDSLTMTPSLIQLNQELKILKYE